MFLPVLVFPVLRNLSLCGAAAISTAAGGGGSLRNCGRVCARMWVKQRTKLVTFFFLFVLFFMVIALFQSISLVPGETSKELFELRLYVGFFVFIFVLIHFFFCNRRCLRALKYCALFE